MSFFITVSLPYATVPGPRPLTDGTNSYKPGPEGCIYIYKQERKSKYSEALKNLQTTTVYDGIRELLTKAYIT